MRHNERKFNLFCLRATSTRMLFFSLDTALRRAKAPTSARLNRVPFAMRKNPCRLYTGFPGPHLQLCAGFPTTHIPAACGIEFATFAEAGGRGDRGEDVMGLRTMLAALALVGIAPDCFAASYFVSTAGSDSWPGTAAQPWRTLQYAAGEVGPGDKVTVRAGSTPAASSFAGFHLTADGTAGAPIEFFAEPGVLINAPNPIRTQHGINLENASHVVIDGFSVTGMQQAGVRSVGINGNTFASHVTIRNVHSYNNGYWGILTGFVNDVLIENNVTSGSAVEHGIYVSNSGDRPVIRNNTVFDNRGNGIHMNGDASLGGDGIISNALVSGNVIYNNAKLNAQGQPGGGSGINMDGVQNSRIENNLLYNNHASGISLYSIDGAEGSKNNVVVNNTVYQASDGRWALNIKDGSTGNIVRNNILLHPGTRGAIDISTSSLPGLTSDYNVVTNRFSISTTATSSTTHTLTSWRSTTLHCFHGCTAVC
jgi:parallel beta-helix repeat protein